MPSAQSIVLLPPSSTDSSGQPTRDVATEIEIAMSQPVLEPAAQKAGIVFELIQSWNIGLPSRR